MSSVLEVRITDAKMLTPVIRELTFVNPSGRLPGFSAGSHVQVHLPLGERNLRNAYSLTSDPADLHHYRIAVRLQDDSRGGSRFLHQQVQVGDSLRISPPANLFALHSAARQHILIAGGIGITPFLAYITALEQRNADFELHYAYRKGLTDAYTDELQQRLGTCLHGYDRSAGETLDLAAVLSARPLGSHVYVCGPERLLMGVKEQAKALGWPEGRVHWEAFSGAEPGLPFSLELARSGRRIQVSAEQSLLEALESAGVEIPNLCRGGVCGQCATRHLKGDIEHRDHVLSAAEQAEFLMPCVSRACGSSVLLDL
ncbi:PDR/VanB family oxidoreductase [Pseudomonas sp. MH9.2]|uniref:PDR/VanB family oxidoreductase n=1 Tax=unclassified Pseudomonas TaxID=196821 RepID=UPI002AC8A7C4|nr:MULTISPECIES: PDR/VanB family oxidoreductase [unclassified Pseudomonas]MEB0009167.1 PDR/VanB family oxidoreductase [Pseudomonas sp. RTB2]MEB0018279.1 PDR/VanB family oxidoreductase [Pseudomonas sp. RTB3]MEB0025309.1 PDR/VanB family oxidoreductase [Pseudomonas sp. MH9.2]MEB0147158.1 PDR/VanB family oxidoreductase [Pseudomonas sp. CCC2.2]MEB0268500.1 PDR/VanB family oxidoreductase [Pseudomonas sp. 5B4]